MFKKGIQRKLEKYVRKYFETHPDIKLRLLVLLEKLVQNLRLQLS